MILWLMVSKALDKSKNTAKVRFFDALSLAFANDRRFNSVELEMSLM